METLRIKEVAKSKGLTLDDVAKRIGITYQSFNKRLNTAKLDTLKEVAEILECDIHELLEPGSQYAHFYDPKTEEWLGIRKR